MPRFAHDGLEFRYYDAGEGLPVVFQHGLGCDLRQITALFPPPTAFRLLSMDFRGHGETQPLGPPEKLALATVADDLVALMDGREIGQAVLGGSSMGAAVALNLALRFPRRVRALVLYRPCWVDRPLPANAAVFVSVTQFLRQYGAKEGREQIQRSEEYQGLLRQSPYVAAALLALFDDPRAEETAVKFARIADDAPCHSLAELAAVRVPTLVLANRQDPVHPYEYGEILAQTIPAARFCEVPPKSDGEPRHAADVRRCVSEFLHSLEPKVESTL